MARIVEPPRIDLRKASDLKAQLRRRVPGYTPEWPAADDDDPGVALIDAFSVIAEGVVQQLNQAPRKNFIEFLNMLGLKLTPARPASVPVQFRLATGLTTPVLVPARTRCSAPAKPPRKLDLPFESAEDLWAVPSALTALVAVDPITDRIYQPPRKFLELKQAARPLPTYSTVSFTAARSKSLQLDRVDGLDEPGDLLRITVAGAAAEGRDSLDCTLGSDAAAPGVTRLYVETADKPNGRIVPLRDEVPDLPSGTVVEKVTDFRVFESKNLQEHVLYLGHADLFNVKSAAEFLVRIEHIDAGANLPGFDVAWEYGVKAASGKGIDWIAFEAAADTSNGFGANGVVELIKPYGEIVEAVIGGQQSRWIRARVQEAIPAVPRPRVPRLDRVRLRIASAADVVIQPDQTFANDTPLQLPDILPFGPEPRQFDRFYVASQEVFSKKNALVTLQFVLGTQRTMGPPSATFFGGELLAFARTPAGRLALIRITAGAAQSSAWEVQDPLEGTSLAVGARPAVVPGSAPRLIAFVRGADGQLYARVNQGSNTFSWASLGSPGGAEIVYDPAVVQIAGGLRVFVVGKDRQLYSALVNALTGARSEEWHKHADLANGIASSPSAVADGSEFRVYAADTAGTVHEMRDLGANWVPLVATLPKVRTIDRGGGEDQPTRSSVFAQAHRDTTTNVLVPILAFVDTAGELHEVTFDPNVPNWMFENLSDTLAPPTPGPLVSSPTGAYLGLGTANVERYLYARDEAGDLWEATNDNWIRRGRPVGIGLRLEPFAVRGRAQYGGSSKDVLSTFWATDSHFLAEFRRDFGTGDTASGGPELTLVFESTLPSLPADGAYEGRAVRITSGAGSGQQRTIVAHGAAGHVLRVGAAWSPVPDGTSSYEILDPGLTGTVVSAAGNLITFDLLASSNALTARSGNTIELTAGTTTTLHTLTSDPDPATGNCAIAPAWTGPSSTPTYRIYFESGRVSEATARAVPLGTSAGQADGIYDGDLLTITAGTQAGQSRRIASYSGRPRVAIVQSALATDTTSVYQIEGSAGWLQYEDPLHADLDPQLSWEYWNGRGWLRLDVADTTDHLLTNGEVSFRLPENLEKTDVAGQPNFWIRARLIGGDYGRETFTVGAAAAGSGGGSSGTGTAAGTGTLQSSKDAISPPLVHELTIKYQLDEDVDPQLCITLNNLSFLDETAACVTAGKHFEPFQPLEDSTPSLFLGFDRAFEGGPVRILFVASELLVEDATRPRVTWSFRSENQWKTLAGVDDGTAGLAKQGLLTLLLPEGFQLRSLFDKSLYWLRGSLTEGRYPDAAGPRLQGIFPNSVQTTQAATVLDEILGSSDGEPNQEFLFLPATLGEPPSDWSIIGEPEIRVREALSEEERAELTIALGPTGIRSLLVLGEVQTWVLWKPVDEVFSASGTSRVYRFDPARGRVRFGDGKHGMIPPPGTDNVRAFRYRSGGGAKGNVGGGEVRTLVTAVQGMDSVLNPVEAGGGADVASVDQMLVRGPAQISNRGRAVNATDFESLALEASGDVVKARCVAATDRRGRSRPGWVTVYVVPESRAALPMPSLELRRAVARYLEERSELGLSAGGRIAVEPPRYVPVAVEADVYAVSLDRVAAAEQETERRVREFLHPLRGGPLGEGWEFGRPVSVSDVFVLLESVADVDHIENLRLHYFDRSTTELVEIGSDQLIACSDPRIRMAFV
jgi:hypothetical protein